MSDNYKIIRKTREAVKDLKSMGWTNAKISKEINIVHSMVQDLLDLDEVALNLREATIIKFRAFLEKREEVSDFIDAEMEKAMSKEEHKPQPPKDPEPEEWSPSFQTIILKYSHEDMLDVINFLAMRFAEKGYRLDACLTKIHNPQEAKIE